MIWALQRRALLIQDLCTNIPIILYRRYVLYYLRFWRSPPMTHNFSFPISTATIMDNKCKTNLNSELFPSSPTCNVPGAGLTALQTEHCKWGRGTCLSWFLEQIRVEFFSNIIVYDCRWKMKWYEPGKNLVFW